VLNPESEPTIADFNQANYTRPGIGATQTHLKHFSIDRYAAQTDDE
jgi:hypothetical protein